MRRCRLQWPSRPPESDDRFKVCFIRWEVARTVVAPPSSVIKWLWEVFVWGFGVLFWSCACVSVSGVLFSVGVCACVTC